jgi:hypothetical protein
VSRANRAAASVRGPARLLAACLIASTLIATAAPSAQAGRWILLSCRQPDGAPAPTEGWTATATGPLGPYSGDSNTCTAGGALSSNSSGEGPQTPYAGPEWLFSAPVGSTIGGGTLTATLTSPHGQAWLGTPSATYDAADVLANCQYNLACGTVGTLSGTFPITHTGGSHIYAAAVCVGAYEGATSCPAAGGSDATVSLSAAEIELYSHANPGGSGFGGGLLAPEARGAQQVTFTAIDGEGPGVYLITVAVDGQVLYSATPDSNGGSCAANTTIEGVRAFTSLQPCRQSETVQVPVANSALADGKHELTVRVTDAGGDSSVVYDAQLSTHNAPVNGSPPTISAAGPVQVGSVLGAHTGEWNEPEGAGAIAEGLQWQDCNAHGEDCHDIPGATGTSYSATSGDLGQTLRVLVTASDRDGIATAASAASALVTPASAGGAGAPVRVGTKTPAASPNGLGASAQAIVRLDQRPTLSRDLAHSAVRLRGSLTRADGAPIAGAILEILEGSADAPPRVLERTVTTATGAFDVLVSNGSSRVLSVAYRAYTSDPAYAARAHVSEIVSASVSLRVTPRHTSLSGTIVLSGRVLGSVPRSGVIVELLVRYRGAWEPFRTPRTDASGRFRVAYQFQGATGSFPLRAEVPGGQASFPYVDGRSAAVTVWSG